MVEKPEHANFPSHGGQECPPSKDIRPRTVLVPCMGVGKIVANVTRRAAYQLQGQCPEDVEILSIPAFLAGDPDEQKLAREHPTLIIDGCNLRCAAQIFEHAGITPTAKVEVAQLMREFKTGPGKTRKELEETGKRLSEHTTQRVFKALSDEAMKQSFVPPDAKTPCAQACTPAPSAAEPPTPQAVKGVTILPCQGIKRTGGRVTQRAAYLLAEDQFLGQSQVLCISALAAGVPEDVVMFEEFPTMALNGCGKRCASAAAKNFGIPAVAEVNIEEVDSGFDGAAFCLEADLTETEAAMAARMAAVAAPKVQALMQDGATWTRQRADLHGWIHRPAQINAETGFKDAGKGFLVRLAEGKAIPVELAPTIPAHSSVHCEDQPGLRTVASGLFKSRRANPVQSAGRE